MSDAMIDRPSRAPDLTPEQDDYVLWTREQPLLSAEAGSRIAQIAGRLHRRLQEERELTQKLTLELKYNGIQLGQVAVPRALTVDMLVAILESLEGDDAFPKGMSTAERLRVIDSAWAGAIGAVPAR